MSTLPETAVIVDFAAYRAGKAERARKASAAPRRFLWGYPGQMVLVDFPDGKPSIAGRLGSAQSPRG
jgi:hypothetical protein